MSKPEPDLSYIVEDLRQLAVPLEEIRVDPNNARFHPQRSIDGIVASLKRFGQRKPIVVNRNGMATEAGNGTLMAARSLGWTHIAVVRVNDDKQTATAYALVDNRSAELSEWDPVALREQAAELRGGEFDPTTLGWSDDEINGLFEDAKPVVDGKPEPNPSSRQRGKEIKIYMGKFRFKVPADQYNEWCDKLSESVGVQANDMIAEIRRRLGL